MKRKATAITAAMAAGALTAGLILATTTARAQEPKPEGDFTGENCMAPAALKQYLERAFDEGRVASAWTDTGNRAELYAAASGTWTLIEFSESGGGCVLAHGTGLTIDRINLPLRTPPIL